MFIWILICECSHLTVKWLQLYYSYSLLICKKICYCCVISIFVIISFMPQENNLCTTSCRELDGELLYTNILVVDLFTFANRLFHEDIRKRAPIDWRLNLLETVCKQMQTNSLLQSICASKYSTFTTECLLFCNP